jgi:hypothetical protein
VLYFREGVIDQRVLHGRAWRVWYGNGAERLGLPSELTKEDFVAIGNNRIPQSGATLTVRTTRPGSIVSPSFFHLSEGWDPEKAVVHAV